MAGIEQWFQFESKDDKEANRKKYFQKMFPYGEEQKTADEKMLMTYMTDRIPMTEKLYQFLLVKEILMADAVSDEEKTEKLASWYNSKLLKQWSEKDRYVIMAIAEIDKNRKTSSEIFEEADVSAAEEKFKKYSQAFNNYKDLNKNVLQKYIDNIKEKIYTYFCKEV